MTGNDSGPPTSRQRQPLNWPTAFVLTVLAGLAAFVAWLCTGAAVDIWGAQ